MTLQEAGDAGLRPARRAGHRPRTTPPATRGGCHVRGYTIAIEVLRNGAVIDPRVTDGKAGLDILFQNLTAALDASRRLPVRDVRHRRRRARRDAERAHRRRVLAATSSSRPASASGTWSGCGT